MRSNLTQARTCILCTARLRLSSRPRERYLRKPLTRMCSSLLRNHRHTTLPMALRRRRNTITQDDLTYALKVPTNYHEACHPALYPGLKVLWPLASCR